MSQGDSAVQSAGSQQEGDTSNVENPQRIAAEMAKAFQELAKGEQTASALERQLDGIESRLDQLLAQAEETASRAQLEEQDPSDASHTNGTDASGAK